MKYLYLLTAVALTVPPANAQTHVQGYVKQDGTYVQPHFRTAPDATPNNNWSTSPNVNPYTGQQGTHQPNYGYQVPTSPQNNFSNQFGQPRR